MPLTREQVTEKRDKKVREVMQDLAPIWLANEEFRPHEDSVLFNLVYQSQIDGWIDERFKYDGWADVLYHMGRKLLREDATLAIQEQEPYINGEVSTRVPNAPDHRLSPPR